MLVAVVFLQPQVNYLQTEKRYLGKKQGRGTRSKSQPPETKSGIELRILEKLFTEREAELFLDLSLGMEKAEFIADRTDWTVQELEPLLEDSEQRPDFRELYSVNVVLSQDDKTLRPVVEQNTPSLINLLGTVDPQKPNNLLTGRWLLTLEDSPNAMRFVEVSPSGNVTCYKMDGKTIDAVPGYQENWTVKGNIIESISQGPSPPKPLLTMMTQATSKMISGDRNPLERARYGYKMKDDSTLQLELLDSPTPQCVTLTRVSASNEQHDMTSNKANEHQSLEK